MAITRDQLIIADLIGTVAILIATIPFFSMAVKQYQGDQNDKKNHSFATGVFTIYATQIFISFMFFWFIKLWDAMVKNEKYKLLGSNGAFSVWWSDDWKAQMNSASDNPAISGLWAYQGMVKVPFEAFFSFMLIIIPVAAFSAAILKESQTKSSYREGSDFVNQIMKSIFYMVLATLLLLAYIDIASFTTQHPTGFLSMVQNWWKDILLGTGGGSK